MLVKILLQRGVLIKYPTARRVSFALDLQSPLLGEIVANAEIISMQTILITMVQEGVAVSLNQ